MAAAGAPVDPRRHVGARRRLRGLRRRGPPDHRGDERRPTTAVAHCRSCWPSGSSVTASVRSLWIPVVAWSAPGGVPRQCCAGPRHARGAGRVSLPSQADASRWRNPLRAALRISGPGPLAQLARAFASHAKGHWFESSTVHDEAALRAVFVRGPYSYGRGPPAPLGAFGPRRPLASDHPPAGSSVTCHLRIRQASARWRPRRSSQPPTLAVAMGMGASRVGRCSLRRWPFFGSVTRASGAWPFP